MRWTAVMISISSLALLGGCGTDEQVCVGRTEHIVVLPSTSKSDHATSLDRTPAVADAAVSRAASSCSRLTVGILNNSPTADLELASFEFAPEVASAVDRTPVVEKMLNGARSFLEEKLLQPLSESRPSGGSPFLGALSKVGDEATAHGWSEMTILIIGDGVDVEISPETGTEVAFGKAPIDEAVLKEFVPALEQLEGSCVVLLGAGAESELDAASIRAGQAALRSTLTEAGVEFVSTRSFDIPEDCGAGSAA